MNGKTTGLLLNAATILVVLLAGALGVLRVREYLLPEPIPGQVAQDVPEWQKYANGAAYFGDRKAPVTIVEFSDFKCPYCKEAAADLKALRREMADSIALVYRHVALHAGSRTAALAAECAARQGAFEKMHDQLFAEADSIGVRSWNSFAVGAGIVDTNRFGTCLVSLSADSAIARDSAAASALGIRGTPTFLINQRQFSGNIGMVALRRAAHEALPKPTLSVRLRHALFSAK